MSKINGMRKAILRSAWFVRALAAVFFCLSLFAAKPATTIAKEGYLASVTGTLVEVKRKPIGISGGYRAPIWKRYRTTLQLVYIVDGVSYELISDKVHHDHTPIPGEKMLVYYPYEKPHRAYLHPGTVDPSSTIWIVVCIWIVYELVRMGMCRRMRAATP
mgnify:CR=1 FL=1